MMFTKQDWRVIAKALEDLSYDDYPDDPEVQAWIVEFRRVRDKIKEARR